MFKIFLALLLVAIHVKGSPVFSMDEPNIDQYSNARIQEIIPKTKYASQKGKDLWFVAERLDEHNQEYWSKYVKQQLDFQAKMARIHKFEPQSKIISSALDGVRRFGESLPYWNTTNVWIIYAYIVKPTHDSPKMQKIEMTFILFVDPKSPFSSHMGIARGMSHMFWSQQTPVEYPFHRNISPYLHAFAATFTRVHYPANETMPEKKFMITVPIEGMHTILMRAGLPQKSIHLGDNRLRSMLSNLIHNYETTGHFDEKRVKQNNEFLAQLEKELPDEYKAEVARIEKIYNQEKDLLATLEEHPSVIFVSHDTRSVAGKMEEDLAALPSDFKWTLFDRPKGSPLLEVTPKNFNDYTWFFKNPSTQPKGTDAFYFAVDLGVLANLDITPASK